MSCDAVIAHQRKCEIVLFQHVLCQGLSIHEKDANIRLRCAPLERIGVYTVAI